MSDYRLASITLDCADAQQLATFYAELLGLETEFAADDASAIALRLHGDTMLSFVRVEGYQTPSWPGASDGSGMPTASGQQAHLDIYVPDLDAGVARAITLGARLAEHQPQPDMWRVVIDPAGHPLCLMLPFGG